MRRYTVVNKLKIIVGFYQIAIKVDRVYEIRLPAEIRTLLHQLELVISLGFEGVPLACVGAEGYTQRLILWMLIPLLIIGGTGVAIAMKVAISSHFTAEKVFKRLMPIILRVFFLAYPVVTNVAFEAFCACMRFERHKLN